MYYIGIGLCENKIVAGLVKDNAVIAGTTVDNCGCEIYAKLADICGDLIKSASITFDDVGHIGVATDLDFSVDELKKKVPCDVYTDNYINAVTIGENNFGIGKGTPTFILITLDESVGCGVIIDGKPYRGFNNLGSEFSHMVINYNGRACDCGRKGCFDAYASTKGFRAFADEKNVKLDNVKAVFDSAKQGNADSQSVIDDYVAYLASGIIDIVNMFQPEILAIGGEIGWMGDALLDPLNVIINREKYARNSSTSTSVKTASLNYTDAVILGAALLNN